MDVKMMLRSFLADCLDCGEDKMVLVEMFILLEHLLGDTY